MRYKSFYSFLSEHICFGDGEKLLHVCLMDRDKSNCSNRSSGRILYESFVRTYDELIVSAMVCKQIREANPNKKYRGYVTYNTANMSMAVIMESIKDLLAFIQNNQFNSRRALSVVQSNLIKSLKRQTFMLDVDTKDEIELARLFNRLSEESVEVLYSCETTQGYHVLVQPSKDFYSDFPLVELKKANSYLSLDSVTDEVLSDNFYINY